MTESIRVQWLGDIALTAQWLDPANHGLLEQNAKFLRANLLPADLLIANWEAPLIGEEGTAREKRIALHTDHEAASRLSCLGLNVAVVANNHIFDCFRSGFQETISFFRSRNTVWVGAGLSPEDAAAPLQMEVKGTGITLLAYVDEDTHPRVPPGRSLFLNRLEPDRALDEVGKWSRQGRIVLVHLHCGMDFVSLPAPKHRKLARALVEAGAAAVICYHPHRLQGYERHAGGCIFYGLGNTIAGEIYPWPRFCEPTVAVTCEITPQCILELRIQHFLFRKGRLELDGQRRGERHYIRQNQKIAVEDEGEYEKHWARALMREMMLTRPLHFLKRHKNPFRLLSALEKRHLTEILMVLRGMAGRERREERGADEVARGRKE